MAKAEAGAHPAASGVGGCAPGLSFGRTLDRLARYAATSALYLFSAICHCTSACHFWWQVSTSLWIWPTSVRASARLLAGIVCRIMAWLLATTWLIGRPVRVIRLDRLIPARFWLIPRKIATLPS